MEEIYESPRSRPWFLNVSGNRFLVDCLKLTLIVAVVTFVAFIFLVIVFPQVFRNYQKRSKGSLLDLARRKYVAEILDELSREALRSLESIHEIISMK